MTEINASTPRPTAFTALGLPERPIFLAPLAGVSDHPFRRICARQGADLTYVEMLSATALVFENPRTYQMAKRHDSEKVLGVQLTGKSADEVARAVKILNAMPFETIDINMGCPVAKVVKASCGSAILKDPARVGETVRKAKAETDKPLSVKIRLGFDDKTRTGLECALAAAEAGAAWVTVHGRLRSDDYGVPVDLEGIAEIKRRMPAHVPVLGNGNIFGKADATYMYEKTGVDGIMVSRGALGNPWLFRELKAADFNPDVGGDAAAGHSVSLDEWLESVLDHLAWQAEEYGGSTGSAVCMRKHLLWYLKGWNGARAVREQMSTINDLKEAAAMVRQFAESLKSHGQSMRHPLQLEGLTSRFIWDPKYEMDRSLDRGVGDELMNI